MGNLTEDQRHAAVFLSYLAGRGTTTAAELGHNMLEEMEAARRAIHILWPDEGQEIEDAAGQIMIEDSLAYVERHVANLLMGKLDDDSE